MHEREAALLDSAIEVLAAGGARHLTHRAVDARAGLPPGSTSNRFRSREALLVGVLQRLVHREAALWRRLTTHTSICDPDALADVLGRAVDELSGPERRLTRARYAIVTQAEFPGSLIAELRSAREVIRSWLEPLLVDLGSGSSAADAVALLALVEGLLLTRLATPAEPVDTRRSVRGLLTGLLPAAADPTRPHPEAGGP